MHALRVGAADGDGNTAHAGNMQILKFLMPEAWASRVPGNTAAQFVIAPSPALSVNAAPTAIKNGVGGYRSVRFRAKGGVSRPSEIGAE